MGERYGKWPGVVAVCGDAEMLCVPCAKVRYGDEAIDKLLEGRVRLHLEPIYQEWQGKQVKVGEVPVAGPDYPLDSSESPLEVVLHGSPDVHGMYCDQCMSRLCDEECSCYLLIL